MPRPTIQNACHTCRRRKLKCTVLHHIDGKSRSNCAQGSLHTPICNQCQKSHRYCDRTERPINILQHDFQSADITQSPRRLLEDGRISELFHSYIRVIAPWYDLGDTSRAFELDVPSKALDEPLLFHAALALSAMHACKTSAPSLISVAEKYHASCVKLLLSLKEDDPLVQNGVALAATCLLRSYEILGGKSYPFHPRLTRRLMEREGETDPNVHLRGAYSMASIPNILSISESPPLLEKGFWNYLREDITFSLIEECPIKMDLLSAGLDLEARADGNYLNSITLILGQIINSQYKSTATTEEWEYHLQTLQLWHKKYSERILPFSRPQPHLTSSPLFPVWWYLQPSHASAMHYYLVSLVILWIHSPVEMQGSLLEMGVLDHTALPGTEALERLSMDICGIVFTGKVPAVLVNAFGPISFCCKFIEKKSVQEELERQLNACNRDVGWPVQRLVTKLKAYWDRQTRHQDKLS